MAKIRIKRQEIAPFIDGMERHIRTVNYRRALKKVLPKLRRLETKVFALEASPDGTLWPSLAQSTIREKKRLGYGRKKILVRTGRLRNSLTRVNHPDNIARFRTYKSVTTLFWGTKVSYGIYHQSDEPRTRLPRRKFLPEDGDVLFDLIVDPVFDEILDNLKKKWI